MPAVAIGFALLCACIGGGQRAGAEEPVELDGDIATLHALVGAWVGDVIDVDSGETGTVRFSLRPDATTGAGELVLHPYGERGLTTVPMRSVRVGLDRRVHIRLRSFADPECRCDIRIELSGELRDDEMAGNYLRIRRGQVARRGRWSMTRQ